jgi:glycosyltransferase A (GT-A) superfamily protein (DUF2064 family)
MDTPQLSAEAVASPLAPAARQGVDAWFGPAEDGGFWAFGLARPELARRLLPGVPMSTGHTGKVLLERMEAAGLLIHRLPDLEDVDTAQTAEHVAALIPESRFGTCWTHLSAVSQ